MRFNYYSIGPSLGDTEETVNRHTAEEKYDCATKDNTNN
jgi:hypothetical protein